MRNVNSKTAEIDGHREEVAGLASRVFVVVAAYNESKCLNEVLRDLVACYTNTVVVDDGSTDTTLDEARRHTRFALRHIVNRGQGAAIQTGIDFALRRGADYIVTFDADGQHRVEDVALLLAPVVGGECDVALGSRFLGGAPGIPSGRRVLLRLAVLFTRLVSPRAGYGCSQWVACFLATSRADDPHFHGPYGSRERDHRLHPPIKPELSRSARADCLHAVLAGQGSVFSRRDSDHDPLPAGADGAPNMRHLTAFQLVLLSALSLFLLTGIVSVVRGWLRRREGLVWIAICLAGGAAVVWPDGTSIVAKVLGIGRGADLLIYCTTLIMMAGFWATYTRLQRMRQEMTQLVRHLALLEAERELVDSRKAPTMSRQDPPVQPSQAP